MAYDPPKAATFDAPSPSDSHMQVVSETVAAVSDVVGDIKDQLSSSLSTTVSSQRSTVDNVTAVVSGKLQQNVIRANAILAQTREDISNQLAGSLSTVRQYAGIASPWAVLPEPAKTYCDWWYRCLPGTMGGYGCWVYVSDKIGDIVGMSPAWVAAAKHGPYTSYSGAVAAMKAEHGQMQLIGAPVDMPPNQCYGKPQPVAYWGTQPWVPTPPFYGVTPLPPPIPPPTTPLPPSPPVVPPTTPLPPPLLPPIVIPPCPPQQPPVINVSCPKCQCPIQLPCPPPNIYVLGQSGQPIVIPPAQITVPVSVSVPPSPPTPLVVSPQITVPVTVSVPPPKVTVTAILQATRSAIIHSDGSWEIEIDPKEIPNYQDYFGDAIQQSISEWFADYDSGAIVASSLGTIPISYKDDLNS